MNNWASLRAWLHGLLGATIAGAAAGVGLALAAPSRFDLFSPHGFSTFLKVMPLPAIGGACLYLKQSPLPVGSKTVVTKQEATVEVFHNVSTNPKE